MVEFKNILCAVDFSPCSRHALTVASELAKAADATLTIVHVWQPPFFGAPEAPLAGEVIQSFANDAERMLADWTASVKADGVKDPHSKFIVGVAWDEIVRLATSSHADLIVIGTRGRTGLAHVLLGSVAEKVVRHAPCAVMVLR